MSECKAVEYQKQSIIRGIIGKVQRLFKRLKGDYKPEKSSLYLWAKAELDRLIVGCEKAEGKDGLEMQEAINKDILEIVKIFCTQGHSGFSASYALNRIKRLLDWKPITALTGEESEWGEVPEWDSGSKTQQNKRCSAVFRDNYDNSTANYIDGRVFSDNGGHSWFFRGGRGGNGSSIPVIFPFVVPEKSEHIYLNGEDSEEALTDENRIKELYDEWTKKYEDPK
jgi:hypothetical protein